jgi:hypothetical protein
MINYLILGMGIWCLYYAWRGVSPNAWNPGSKVEAGKPMPRSTRFAFVFGGALLTAFGLLLVLLGGR